MSQAVLLGFSYFASFQLRFEFNLVDPYRAIFQQTLPLMLATHLLVFWYFQLFRGWWRYVGMSDLLDIIKAALAGSVLLYGAVYAVRGIPGYPRSVFVIHAALTVIIIGGLRFAVRAYTESARVDRMRAHALIVGAGAAGRAIAAELLSNEQLGYQAAGFIDDDPAKRGERIRGLRVLGTTEEIARVVLEHEVSQILIAIPSATGRQMQKIINACVETRVEFKTLPALGDIINGSVSLGQMRRVQVEDLLSRAPVHLDLEAIRRKFSGRAVLITGAGGSIGSELARQLARFHPGRLVLFERSETDLHHLDLELSDSFPRTDHVPVVGDIQDENRLREVFAAYQPTSVFHAAAYKHVPMMERNCFQAVTNNIIGTYRVARMAGEAGVEDFVLISSDKAVNPTNIMGVSKRIAELLILGLQDQSTHYLAVRFGNVLASSGSVVPRFEKQIAMRKPVTVTHPEARRYFMTIPEAVQLVLQASTMGKGGEIFVLDMGEPVKIVDLANNLILLSGLEPGRDIPIVFTGLRPGEKLYEELRLTGEGLKPTTHEKIHVLDGGRIPPEQAVAWVAELGRLAAARDVRRLVAKLAEIVPEYTPSPSILKLAAAQPPDLGPR